MPWIPNTMISSAAGALVSIYDETLVADAASFDVQGIPQAYKHLKILFQGRGTQAAVNISLLARFNNDSGGNYDQQEVSGNSAAAGFAATVAQTSGRVGYAAAASGSASRTGSFEMTVFNYTGTAFHKQAVSHNEAIWGTAAADAQVGTLGFSWRDTAAVNRFTLLPSAANFLAGSRLTIYGLS